MATKQTKTTAQRAAMLPPVRKPKSKVERMVGASKAERMAGVVARAEAREAAEKALAAVAPAVAVRDKAAIAKREAAEARADMERRESRLDPAIAKAEQRAAHGTSHEPAIPAFLDRKLNGIKDNPVVPGPKLLTEVVNGTFRGKPVARATSEADAKAQQEVLAQQAEIRRLKGQVRGEKRAAAAAGNTKAMPVTGKAALRVIAQTAIDNGHKITKVPAGVRAADLEAKPQPKGKAPAKPKAPKAPKADLPRAKTLPAGAKQPKGAFTAEVIDRTTALLNKGTTAGAIIKANGWEKCGDPCQRVRRYLKDVAIGLQKLKIETAEADEPEQTKYRVK